MRDSIRRRLLLTLLSITVAIWTIAVITSYYDARHEIGELFDAQLAQSARTLLSVAGHELEELEGRTLDTAHIHFHADSPLLADGHEYEHKLAYQLWKQPENTLLLRSFSAPDSPLSELPSGFSTRPINSELWRVLSLRDEDSGFQVQVGQALAIREELTDDIARRIGIPIAIALPLLALLIFIGIGRSMRPLQRLAEAVVHRAPNNLEPIDSTNVPSEIRPLVNALNSLFERLGNAFEHDRRFTADAAHELRTPLAAMKTQAQVAKRSKDPAERDSAIGKMLEGVDRATRLVEQLLTLARVDPETGLAQGKPVDLLQLAENAIADHEQRARTKGITLQLKADKTHSVTGHQDSLSILLRNLLDNAIRYTPEGGNVRISLAGENGSITMCIADSGPGVPEKERERIFDRFIRLAGQETSGSGLGLSIVQRIAELHQARIRLGESTLGGLEICVRFPAG